MTYILNKQQKCLREKATMQKPNYEWKDSVRRSFDYWNEKDRYEQHIASLKQYHILPEQWEGYEDGAEVGDGEFKLDCKCLDAGQSRYELYAIPKQKQVSQTDSIKELFVDKLLAQLKEKDKRIKELEEALQMAVNIISFEMIPIPQHTDPLAINDCLATMNGALQNKSQ